MSRRKLELDPIIMRKDAYKRLDNAECQEALWEALAYLSEQGLDVGPKAVKMLQKRHKIKQGIAK